MMLRTTSSASSLFLASSSPEPGARLSHLDGPLAAPGHEYQRIAARFDGRPHIDDGRSTIGSISGIDGGGQKLRPYRRPERRPCAVALKLLRGLMPALSPRSPAGHPGARRHSTAGAASVLCGMPAPERPDEVLFVRITQYA
jgi:hypothetical protein